MDGRNREPRRSQSDAVRLAAALLAAVTALPVLSAEETAPLASLPEGIQAGYLLRLRDLPLAVQERASEVLLDVNEAGRVFLLIDDVFTPLPLPKERKAPQAFRIDSRERVTSFAIMRDGSLLAIAGRSLALFDGSAFRPLTQLPSRGMRVAPAGPAHAYLHGGETPEQRKTIYLLRADGSRLALIRADQPVSAVAGSGDVTFFASGRWVFLSRAGEPVVPVFHAGQEVTALAMAPPAGLFVATADGLSYVYDTGRAYRVFRGEARPVVRAGRLFTWFPARGDLLVADPVSAFEKTAAILRQTGARRTAADAVEAPQLSAAAKEAFTRAEIAVAKSAWDTAATWFAFAQEIDPWSPQLLFNLGQVNARTGRDLAAIAWFRAYLSVRPDAPDGEAVRTRIERLRQRVEQNVVRITTHGQQIHQQLERGGIRPGTIREYTELSIRTAAQRGEFEAAAEASLAVEDVTDRDQVWVSVATHLMEWPDDLDLARQAAARIGDPALRAGVLARIEEQSADSVPDEPAAGASAALQEWVRLARFLSSRGSTARLTDELRKAARLPLKNVSIGLLQVATGYACDYLRLREIEERQAGVPHDAARTR